MEKSPGPSFSFRQKFRGNSPREMVPACSCHKPTCGVMSPPHSDLWVLVTHTASFRDLTGQSSGGILGEGGGSISQTKSKPLFSRGSPNPDANAQVVRCQEGTAREGQWWWWAVAEWEPSRPADCEQEEMGSAQRGILNPGDHDRGHACLE